MKTRGLKWILSLFFLMSGLTAVNAQQERADVPGDNFSLEGALELFKKSSSPEEFEKVLNSPDSKVNNLDLNGDGYVDYVRVMNRKEGNVHIFILQAVIAQDEFQDIAVISLEKLANGKAVLQITGDEDIYGIETIIEPTQEVYVNAGTTSTRTVVNVWTWPAVQYIYSPGYTVWVSPWRWSYRPVWWYSWRPVAYHVYDPWWYPYRPYYSVCYTHRIVYRRHIYHPYRTTSVVVHNRYHDRITHYRSTHHYDSRNGRNRYDGDSRRSSQHDGNSGGRQRPNYNQNENNRSTRTNWSQQTRDNSGRSSNSHDSYAPTRTSNDSRDVTKVQERSSNSQRNYTIPERKSSTSTYDNSNPQRKSNSSTPTYSSPQRKTTENTSRSYPTKQREYSAPSRSGNSNRNSAPNVQRSSSETPRYSAPQRSSGSSSGSVSRSNVSKQSAPSNSRSSGSSGVQRSGGSKSSESSGNGRRGRD